MSRATKQENRRLSAEIERFNGIPPEEIDTDVLCRPVNSLELSVRSSRCLEHAGIQWIYQLVERVEGDMLKIKNFGRKNLKEVKEALAFLGLSLGMTLSADVKAKIAERLGSH